MRRITSSREVVLALTGSIAAYKGCVVASQLTQLGARVIPVMTRSARNLVGVATLEALCGHRVISEMFEEGLNPNVAHIEIARRANLFLVAPATANILAKAANGIADDWLSTTLLATEAPILFAPAMNTNMYNHPATRANIKTLRARGNHFVGPDSGYLAEGTTGLGRMVEPDTVIEAALPFLETNKDLAGRHVVMTSGANHEPIDPVRFIGNRSSGKMGRAIAEEALVRGARITAVCGPSDTAMPYGVDTIPVGTAQEMADAVIPLAEGADVFIGAAAVADYRVTNPGTSKLKREGKAPVIELTENLDIAAAIGKAKRPGQISVVFAAETDDLVENARAKLDKKRADLVVVNEVGKVDSGFGSDMTRAAIIGRDGVLTGLQLLTKEALAEKLLTRVVALLGEGNASRSDNGAASGK